MAGTWTLTVCSLLGGASSAQYQGSRLALRGEAGDVPAAAWSYQLPDLPDLDGAGRLLEVRSTDAAGNASVSAVRRNVIIDNVPPRITILRRDVADQLVRGLVIDGTGVQGLVAEAMLDSGRRTRTMVPVGPDGSWRFMAPGSSTAIWFTATDLAGNRATAGPVDGGGAGRRMYLPHVEQP